MRIVEQPPHVERLRDACALHGLAFAST